MDGTSCGREGRRRADQFHRADGREPYSYNYEPPPGVPPRNTREETHTVKIIDARPFNDTLSLEREGFVLLRHPTAATDLYDEAQITHVYYPECERLIKDYTGAVRVMSSTISCATPRAWRKGSHDQGLCRPRP